MGEDEYFNGAESLNLNLAEICGKQYVIEHIVTDYRKRSAEKLYKTYITDILKAIAESQRVSVNQRFYDMICGDSQGENIEQNVEQKKANILKEFERLGG